MRFLGRKRDWQGDDVLGINRRNLDYVYHLNERRRFRLVDDKIVAKDVLTATGLPVPRTIAAFADRREIPSCLDALGELDAFVVKPARGFGGSGVKAYGVGGACVDWDREREELAFHMAAILSGMFALDAVCDRVLVEELLREDEVLLELHGGAGVSDIRVIVCDSKPVMAMLRIPCLESKPTANLHAGGIGIGVELASGRTTHGVQYGKPLASHPDTGVSLSGIELPHWSEVLRMAEPLNEAFGLGYLGADIVVDAERGPLILEVNARPGLAIQLANRRGLLAALRAKLSRSDDGGSQ